MSLSFSLSPIGVFHCPQKYTYEVPRQGSLNSLDHEGFILLSSELSKSCLIDLEGFSHIWILYHFHQNSEWHAMVSPPRQGQAKVGVFASRSPHRPNPIGLSLVRLNKIKFPKIYVSGYDLIDQTPVLDIKPYLQYSDSPPSTVQQGWVDALPSSRNFQLNYSEPAQKALHWLNLHKVLSFESFLQAQLSENPTDQKRKRIQKLGVGKWEISYRTWRVQYTIDEPRGHLIILSVSSGYSPEELNGNQQDPYQDKETHRKFLEAFKYASSQ